MEIERKWLLNNQPNFPEIEEIIIIEQGYIAIEDGEIRIRKMTSKKLGVKYFITIKSEGSIARQEWEQEIPQWTYELLMETIRQKIISKALFKIPLNNLYLEFHAYLRSLDGLFIMECEFPNLEEAEAFEIPNWIIDFIDKEVTDDPRYKNKNLAINGLPK